MLDNATKLTEHSSDHVLREGCCQGNPRAQEYLYRRWFGKLLSIPMRYTSHREEAVEVLNSAFLKIFHVIQKYRETEKGTFSGWMARIVFNTTMDHVRSHSRYKRIHDLNTEADRPVQNDVLGKLAADDIFRFVQQLPTASRNVFSLSVLDGYKHAEIAEMLGINAATSRWHLGQARKALRKLVTEHYINA